MKHFTFSHPIQYYTRRIEVCQWLEKRWCTLRDLLIYYNLLDSIHFMQAVSNLLSSYKQQELNVCLKSFFY